MAVYFATKAYVLSLSEALHEELKLHGIKVSCLCPGPTATEFGDVAGFEGKGMFDKVSMRADKVVISGELEGNVVGASSVELQQTGVVVGDLKARSLSVFVA